MNDIQPRSIAYVALSAVLVLGSLPLSHLAWRGNTELHSLLETIATLMAFTAGAMALVRYYTHKTTTYLLLGSGLVGAGVLDLYHTLVTSTFFAGSTPSALSALTPWTGVTSRVLLSALICGSSLLQEEPAPAARAGPNRERLVYLVVAASTLASFLFFALVPLPPAYYPNWWLHRPAELVPAFFFSLAAAARFRTRAWKTDSFEHWLLLSLIAAAAGHLFYMSFSAELYDAHYVVGHLVKILAFNFLLTGLFVSMFSVYGAEAESVARLSMVNQLLGREVEERTGAEAALREVRVGLEAAVRARTADLAEQSQRLSNTHAEIELFLTSIPSMLIGLDQHGKITRWNPTASEVLGVSGPEALGRTLDDCGIQWVQSDIGAEVARWLRSETLQRCDDLAYKKDGKTRSLGLTVRPIFSTRNDAIGFIITGADITERKKTEAALSLLAAIVESSDAAIIGTDREGTILTWNAAAERTYGYSFEEVRDRPVSLLWPPERGSELADVLRRLNRLEDVAHVESTRVRKDGECIPVLITYSPIRDASGQVVSCCSISVDITERKRLEGQLAQAQKLESIGQLAAGIAHEINTPIQYIGDNTRFVQDSFAKVDEVLSAYDRLLESVQSGAASVSLAAEIQALAAATRLSYLRSEIPQSILDCLEGVSRVAEIVRAIKEFSHPGPLEKTALDMNRAIESTILVSRNEWKYVAEVETDLDPHLPLAQCVAGEFNQVVLNLIVNAAHAIADVVAQQPGTTGKIRVSTRRDGGWVELRVRDTGTGIPEKARPNIFNPFFTTKAVGKGTGQGLSIAHTVIVQKHGGTIGFETEMGVGTTFIVRIPIGEEPPESTDSNGGANHAEEVAAG